MYVVMMMQEQEAEGYITLKQASERFGYSPDYIGQLIRKGKIEGKQVYANVAWMTTEEALRSYIEGNGPREIDPDQAPRIDQVTSTLFTERSVRVLTWLLRVLFGILMLLGVLIFYFLSISIDDRLARKAEASLAARVQQEMIARVQELRAQAESDHTSDQASIITHAPVAYGQ